MDLDMRTKDLGRFFQDKYKDEQCALDDDNYGKIRVHFNMRQLTRKSDSLHELQFMEPMVLIHRSTVQHYTCYCFNPYNGWTIRGISGELPSATMFCGCTTKTIMEIEDFCETHGTTWCFGTTDSLWFATNLIQFLLPKINGENIVTKFCKKYDIKYKQGKY